jgi:hypothetical protein
MTVLCSRRIAEALLAATLGVAVIGCRTDPPPPPAVHPVAAPVAPAAPAPVDVREDAGAPPPAAQPRIPCETDDDCWLDGNHRPIPRPAKLRGRKVRPCADSEYAPACREGACTARHFKC